MAAAIPDGSAALPDSSLAAIAPTIAHNLQSNESFRAIHQAQVLHGLLRFVKPDGHSHAPPDSLLITLNESVQSALQDEIAGRIAALFHLSPADTKLTGANGAAVFGSADAKTQFLTEARKGHRMAACMCPQWHRAELLCIVRRAAFAKDLLKQSIFTN
jgi:hypothetical protein